MKVVTPSREALAGALAEHQPVQDCVTGLWGCMCGDWEAEPRETVTGAPWNHWGAVEGEYHAHVADSLPVVPLDTLADDEALRFSEEDIEYAQEAMQEGEWQWFQWLLRERVRALAAALSERGDR
jgi:hypothetical protein